MKRLFVITFLFYLCLGVKAQVSDTTSVAIDSVLHKLPEVMVKGERPLVKASEGKLIYDLPRIVSNLPIENAYDAIKELPGVMDQQGALTLAGSAVNIIINGKVSTMSAEQLTALLKSIPVSRIEKAEVMYAAPARYNVRGAVINLILKSGMGQATSLVGELYSAWTQRHYENFEERGSVLFSSEKLSADILYNYKKEREYSGNDRFNKHLFNGTEYNLRQITNGNSSSEDNNVRLGMDYSFTKDNILSFVYSGQFSNGSYHNATTGSEVSKANKYDDSQLHNLKLDYQSSFGMKMGSEFTYFKNPCSQLFSGVMNNTHTHFLSKDQQRINKWMLYINQNHKLPAGWGINYGVQYTTSTDNSYQYYFDDVTGDYIPTNSMDSRHKEHTFNGFAGFNKNFGEKLSIDASLAAEHYKTEVWNEWTLYPTLNATYTLKPGQILQLSFSGNKQYPSYWSTNNTTSYVSSYVEIQGNPYLRPSREYETNLTYILKSKYIFSAFFNHVPDYFIQLPYQSPDRLTLVYKYHNFNYQQQAGLQTVIPFSVKELLNSRLTLVGYYKREKNNDFYNIPFDRSKYSFMVNMNNTFTVSSKPDIKFMLTGFYQNGTIQGIYDLSRSYNVNTALRWTFANKHAQITLKGDDLFNTNLIKTNINYADQFSTMKTIMNNRSFTLSFSYKFGNYKEKSRKAVDTSRFSK